MSKELSAYLKKCPRSVEEVATNIGKDLALTRRILSQLLIYGKVILLDGKYLIPKKKNKYNNTKVVVNGIKFDSIKESKRHLELKMLLKVKKISELKLQPKFLLSKKVKFNGKTLRSRYYIADFQYIIDNETIVEDVKSIATEEDKTYRLKRHLFLSLYPQYKFIETIT